MNAVLGLSRLLLSTDLSHEQEQYLLMIANSSHLLLTIINDILDYSKIEVRRACGDARHWMERHRLVRICTPAAAFSH